MTETLWGWKKARILFAVMLTTSIYLGLPAQVKAESIEELKAAMAQMQQAMQAMEQRIATMEAKDAVSKDVVADSSPQQPASAPSLKVPEGTTMSIYGYAKLDVLYTDTAGGGKYNYVPKAVPLDSQRNAMADNAFTAHARESRIGFTSSTPTDYGQFNTKIEVDFYGTEGNERTANSHGVRLRLAYGELGNLRVGQDWSTFIDASTYPEVIDFGFPVGRLFVLQPLIRWTQPFEGGSFQFALENPDSYFLTKTLQDDGVNYSNTSLGGNNGLIPDIIARVNLSPGYGKYSVAAMARQLSYDTGTYDDNTWAAAISGNAIFPTFGKDSIHITLSYGTGIGRYMRADFDDAFINPLTQEIETNVQLGGFISYQHFWMDNLRSTLVYSAVTRDNDMAYVTDTVDKSYQSLHANLMWSPIPRIDVGLEYIWGYREVENGEDGDMNRVQGAFKYKF